MKQGRAGRYLSDKFVQINEGSSSTKKRDRKGVSIVEINKRRER